MASDNRLPLLNIIPAHTHQLVNVWFDQSDFIFKLRKTRQTKLGDFRVSPHSKITQITINSDMDPFLSFFIFTHEYAHYLIWKKYKRTKAHGKEWQSAFSTLLLETAHFYPESLMPHILNFAKKPKATLNADKNLLKAFRIFQPENNLVLLETLDIKTKFKLNKRIFIKQDKRRTRFICIEAYSRRKYLINAMAEVEPLED